MSTTTPLNFYRTPNVAALYVPSTSLGLLAGETQGFAIDATSVGLPTYTGGPVGGSVSVIDTGTPANDKSNVALDSSNLTQSGTSPKMVLWNSSPYVRWTPHNLCEQSQTFDNAAWGVSNAVITANDTTAADGTATADKSVVSAATAYIRSAAITTVASAYYTVSVYVKRSSGSNWIELDWTDTATVAARAWFDITNGSVGSTATVGAGSAVSGLAITSVGDGWYRISANVTISTTTNNLQIIQTDADASHNGSTTSTVWLWGAQVVRGYNANPYLVTTTAARIGIPQEYDTAASKFGVLVEPAATNLATYSEDFSNAAWTKAQVTISANATTAPDGSNTADKIVEDSSTNTHEVYQAETNNNPVIHSVYAKAGERTLLGMWSAGDDLSIFDLSNGTITQTGTGISPTITSVGDGWYRCTYFKSGSAQGVRGIGLVSTGTTNNYAGDGSSGLYLWGWQTEYSTVATSYTPTLGSTVTRAADNIIALSSSFPYGSANTAYVSAKAREVASQHDVLEFDANNANEDESVKLYTNATADILMQIEDGAATQLAPLDSAVNASANTTFQVTGAWDTNDVDVSANGTAAASDGTATMPTITHARIGCNPTPGNHLNGYIYKVVVVPRQVETATGDIENWRYTA